MKGKGILLLCLSLPLSLSLSLPLFLSLSPSLSLPGKEIQALLKMQTTEEEPELDDSITVDDSPNIKGKKEWVCTPTCTCTCLYINITFALLKEKENFG